MDNRPSAIEFVRNASVNTLEAFELARRNEAAVLQKEIRTLVWAMASALADAELARLMREARGASGPSGEEGLCLPENTAGVDGAGRRRL